jgi:tetratricopeptide (TPR) repeat protein
MSFPMHEFKKHPLQFPFLLLVLPIFLPLLILVPAVAQEVIPSEEPAAVPELPTVPSTFPEPPSEAEIEAGATVNPLELNQPDPLLPTLTVDRPLSPQERSILDTALDELNQQAQAQLQSGDLAGALQTWTRELRLRRFLGPAEEVESLSRVGEVAWRENQVTEVRLITQRLQEIEQEIETRSPIDYDLLLQIAQAYQTLRARDQAVGLYTQLLLQARQEQNVDREQQILVALGSIHLAWFDFANAATAYDQLLTLARSRNDAATETEALTQLSRIYQDNNQPEQAIEVQQQLVEVYQRQQRFDLITELKQSIGDNYVALDRPDLAATNYQEAFAVARSAQQYAYAGDALQRLANLYVTLERFQDALTVYQLLLDVRQQAYDTLGMMNTYDQIGQLHQTMGNQAQAIAAFQQGLQLAQQLNYKIGYFNTRIEELGRQQ